MADQTNKYGFTFDPKYIPPPAPNTTYQDGLPRTELPMPTLGTGGYQSPTLFPVEPLTTVDPASSRPVWARQPMIWELYDGTMVEMYINPQNVSIQANKKISQSRTKGGFVVQYWGDDLLTMAINGTTGSSGIEGIEILYDVYQSELLPPARLDELKGIQSGYPDLKSKLGVNPGQGPNDAILLDKIRRSDLVSRATQVCLWYGNFKKYYGFFTSFNIQEAAANPGEYIYSMTFMIWKTVGRDKNYMPWHRTPVPLGTGQSGVPESDGNVSIYAIQGATLDNISSLAATPSSPSSPSSSSLLPPTTTTPIP